MEQLMRSLFLSMAQNRAANRWAKRYGLRLGAQRFVAGETIDDAIGVVRALKNQGMKVTLDHLGEFVNDESEERGRRLLRKDAGGHSCVPCGCVSLVENDADGTRYQPRTVHEQHAADSRCREVWTSRNH